MSVLHFHSHHPLSCKESIIYSQALHYNMIILEDHILQEELSNLTCILLARAYPLHLIIKNIKKALTHNRNHLLSQGTPQTGINILPIVTPFSDMGKVLTEPNIEIGTILLMKPFSPPFGHLNPYQTTPNLAAFTTTLLTLHKHMAPHSRTPNTTTRTHPHTPTTDMLTVIYTWRYDHSSYTCFLHDTRHTQLILILWTGNGTSRHGTKIQILSNNYVADECYHLHAVYLGSSVMRC